MNRVLYVLRGGNFRSFVKIGSRSTCFGRIIYFVASIDLWWHPASRAGSIRSINKRRYMDSWFRVPTLLYIIGRRELPYGKPGVKRPFKFPRAKVDLYQNASGRKCSEVFTNTFRNSMKIRVLAFKNFGRKYVKNFAESIAVSEKITTFASQ